MVKNRFCKKLIFLVFSGILFFALPLFAIGEEHKETPLVIVAEIENEIKAGTLQYLKRVIKTAELEKAEYIIIKLDTPGGLLKATRDIVDLILETPIKTIVFVNKEGGWAYSAGVFILLAANYAIVHPEASIGAAQPRIMAGEIIEPDQKIIEGMASWIRSLAEIHQRSPEIAEKFVRENLTLTGKEAKEKGIIDETAKNLEELFLKGNISEPRIKEIKPNFVEKLFDFLSHPYLISLFLTIGGLAIIMAVRAGEFELTGVIGIIALLIGLWGMGIITFSFLGIGLLLVGIFLLIMEIFVEPGFGVFGILGTGIIALGIFTFEAEPFFAPGFFDTMTMIVIGAAIAICALFVIIGRGVAKTFRAKPKTGSESLIGFNAEVVKELNPRGQIKIKQEIWSAKSMNGEMISVGEKVKIIKIEGNTIFVREQTP